jgi:hypothetical protein
MSLESLALPRYVCSLGHDEHVSKADLETRAWNQPAGRFAPNDGSQTIFRFFAVWGG